MIVVFIVFGFVLPASALEFRDLSKLLEKNEKILAKAAEENAAAQRTGQFGRSFLPKVELQAGQESFTLGRLSQRTQPAYGAEASINLFNGGRDYLNSERADLTLQRRSAEKLVTYSEELDAVREIYWQILFQRDLMALASETKNINAENLKAADRRIRGGVATQSDRMEFEMKDVDLKRDIANAEVTLNSLRLDLAAKLGLDKLAPTEFKEKMAHDHDWEKEIKHDHRDHEFLVKPSDLEAQEMEISSRAEARSWMPQLDVFAGYNQYNQRSLQEMALEEDRRETVVGVRLKMDVFDGFNSYRESGAREQEAKSAAYLASYKKREVEAHIDQELVELNSLHSQVHEAEANIERANRYFRLTKSEYARGAKNSPDMLGATEKLFEMKKKHMEILRDFQVAKSHLLSKTGR